MLHYMMGWTSSWVNERVSAFVCAPACVFSCMSDPDDTCASTSAWPHMLARDIYMLLWLHARQLHISQGSLHCSVCRRPPCSPCERLRVKLADENSIDIARVSHSPSLCPVRSVVYRRFTCLKSVYVLCLSSKTRYFTSTTHCRFILTKSLAAS